MKGYLGEELVEDLAGTEFEGWGALEWVAYFVDAYGTVDGEHHKQWLIDAVARLSRGAPVTVKRARWEGGHQELRVSVGTSEGYEQWVSAREAAGYEWDTGIAP